MLEEEKIYTVGELTRKIKEILEEQLGWVSVQGEISNFRIAQSGHCYFVLKDEDAALNCVMWRAEFQLLEFQPKDGMQVQVTGELTVYEPRGQYQLIVETMKESGLGALYKAFVQLKDKLRKEGLFDTQFKKPIPYLPQRIGIVTSPSGAAIRDMLNILNRRFANLHIYIAPVRVQGKEAPPEIVNAIKLFNRLKNVDVIIVGRGGGSIEDLWAFNEEIVARAIFASEIPIISAVGHETDFTIADFVADLRAPTPSAAAELVVKNQIELQEKVIRLRERLKNSIMNRLLLHKTQINGLLKSYAMKQPLEQIRKRQQRIDELTLRLVNQFKATLTQYRHLLSETTARLEALNPTAILSRGYSIVRDAATQRVIKSSQQVNKDQLLSVQLYQGKLLTLVKEKSERMNEQTTK